MNKRISVCISPTLHSMIQELKAVRGDMHDTETIKEAIRFMHSKRFPVYTLGAKPSEEAKVQAVVAHDEAKKSLKLRKGEEICKKLNGIVSKNVCVYFKYDETNRYQQEVPLSLLSDDLVSAQYSPSREIVEEYKRKGKANY